MRMKKRFLTISALTCLLVVGCSGGAQNGQGTARLSQDEVITIAKAKAVQEGFDLSKYDLKGCHYEFTRKDHTWTAFFELKPPTPPGGHFLVWVDDQTRKTTLMQGE
ncbi:MAG: hypothetical protein LUQ04_05790 [Methanoregula sp.]|nr:hypothetical protein [Methanoregula sp.]